MPFLRRRQEDERDYSAAAPSPPAPEPPPVPDVPPALEVPPAPEVQPEPAVESQFRPMEGADEMLDMPLGTLIFRAGLIAPQQLEDALAEGLRSGKRLGEVLLARGWLSEEDLSRLLAGQKGLPYADVERIAIDRELARSMSYEDSRREMALPLVNEFGAPVVAVCDPEEGVMERVRAQLGPETRFVIAAPGALTRVIDEVLGGAAAPASTLLVTPAEPEPLLIGSAPAEEPSVEVSPSEAPPVAPEEPAATPAQGEEAASQEYVPLITAGEIDYPTFDAGNEDSPPPPLGGSLEQLPPDAQMGEYGYFGDSSLLEGNAWQPGESGPESFEPAPETVVPDAGEYAAPEQSMEGEPPAAESGEETSFDTAQEPVPEPSYEETSEQPAAEIGEAEGAADAGTVTPAWMRGEVNVITADVADFIESGMSQEPEVAEQAATDWQPEAAVEEIAEPASEEIGVQEPSMAPEQSAEEIVAEPPEMTEAAVKAEPVAEPASEEPALVDGRQADTGRAEFELVLRLSDGDRVQIGAFPTLEEAQAQAGEVVKQFSNVKDGSWPFIGGRYLRPETIVSIDVEHQDSGWSGSGARGRMFTGESGE